MKKPVYKPKPYQCALCTRRFTRPQGLAQHTSLQHTIPIALEKYRNEELNDSAHGAVSNEPGHTATPTPHSRDNSPTPFPNPPSLPHTPRRSTSRVSPVTPISPRRASAHDRTFLPLRSLRYAQSIDSLTCWIGTPCDAEGYDHAGRPPAPSTEQDGEDHFMPFSSSAEFELCDFLYVKTEMSAGNVDELIEILASLYPDREPPIANHRELHALIDSIKEGDVPWDSFSITYNGPPATTGSLPPWATQQHEVWFRDPLAVIENQLANPEFKGKIDYAPKREFRKFMSGNWAWRQADKISKDEKCHGAMFAPIVLGSDKTTVSVATGQNDFYPLYASVGNIHNSARRSHRDGVVLIGFLAMPKTSREFTNDPGFRKFRRQLFHTSLRRILSSLRPYMTCPKITKCPDGHLRRVVYGIGPYIADYPEQALLACVVQGWCARCEAPASDLDDGALENKYLYRSHDTTDEFCEAFTLRELWDDYGIEGDVVPFTAYFPRADIHELISPDLLHQLIKGTFKDHLIDWIAEYINENHSKQEANRILADIDRRIAMVPPFSGIRRFYEGRGFKQWTGDDSKALMKSILPALAGRVPEQMVHTVRDFLEFTYLVRRPVITEDDLKRLDGLVASFHNNREIFRDLGIRPTGFSLPRQHAMVHYRHLIQEFGAPNGLDSSITESKHIKAVKKPYRRSSRNRPLGQMLVTNQRTDKILAMRIKLRRYLRHKQTRLPELSLSPSNPPLEHITEENENRDGDAVEEAASMGEIKLAKCAVPRKSSSIAQVALSIGCPQLVDRVQQYICNWLTNDDLQSDREIPLSHCPNVDLLRIHTYPSARAVFFSPSDISGIEGMRSERIRAVSKWGGGRPRYDCVLVAASDDPGFLGYLVARVFLFFSFVHSNVRHPCALVQWYSTVGERPCPDTGMWVVQPDVAGSQPSLDVVHLDSIFRAVHLIGVAGKEYLPRDGLDYTHSLDAFKSFYVNKYVDHHAHEILFQTNRKSQLQAQGCQPSQVKAQALKTNLKCINSSSTAQV
ncbi:hypothetical protein BKA70DRAFT_1373002 [Coprinopsis sp. MPI-PUGE-AT-0042]|nr:hypothetical protein BKA70DRAFT_1373002 [Coprinopsis sp. MPI-PUGE-AT-0042]